MVPRKGSETVEDVVPEAPGPEEERIEVNSPQQVCLMLVHSHLKAAGLDKLADKLIKKTQLDLTRFDESSGDITLESIVREFGHTEDDKQSEEKSNKRKRVESSSSSSSDDSSR